MVPMQKIDIPCVGIPSREELDAILSAPHGTDLPAHWIRELVKARDWFDEAEQLSDGSEHRNALIDLASDIEDRAVLLLNIRPAA